MIHGPAKPCSCSNHAQLAFAPVEQPQDWTLFVIAALAAFVIYKAFEPRRKTR